jgi:transposase-like protein
MSAVKFQRQLGLTGYETAFLHKLRAGNRIGGRLKEHVEIDEKWVGGRTRGEGRRTHQKAPLAAAVEVCHRERGNGTDKRKDGRYADRVRLAIAADRGANSLCGFVENAVMPGSQIVTDDWSGYAGLRKRGYGHYEIAESGDPEIAEHFMPTINLVFSNLKTWLGIHYSVRAKHLQAYLNEFTFRFNRRFFRSTRSARYSASPAVRLRPMQTFVPARARALQLPIPSREAVMHAGVLYEHLG